MKLKILYSLLVLYLMASCQDKQEGGLPEIIVNQESISRSHNIDKLVSENKFVTLETNSESLIREISKIEVFNDTILIADYELGKIILFKKDGTFISTISHLGKGPNEYIEIADLTYDRNSGNILLLDIATRQIKKYDLRNNFKGYIDLITENAGYNFEYLNSNFIFYRKNNIFPNHADHNVVIVDSAQRYITSGANIPIPIKGLSMKSYKSIDVAGDSLYINPACNDTIYTVGRNNRIKPIYRFSFQEEWDVKQSKLWKKSYNSIIDFRDKAMRSDKITNVNKLIVFDGHVLFEYYSKSRNLGIYSKNRDETTIVTNPNFSSENLLLNVIGKDDDYVIAQVGANEQYEKLNKIVGDSIVKEFSNPVLYFFKLKD